MTRLATTLACLLVCCSALAADGRVQILPPLDNNRECCQPPSEASIRKALPKAIAHLPAMFTTIRLKDGVDAPRFYPLVGPAQLHHVHWQCAVLVLQPAPGDLLPIRLRAESVYIDQDH